MSAITNAKYEYKEELFHPIRVNSNKNSEKQI